MRIVTLTTGSILAGALVGAGFYVALRPVDLIARAPETPAPSAAPAGAPRGVRQGHMVGVDAAIRELDLIRPSRPKAAEAFTLPTLHGGSFRLADQRGKLVFVNFWATWCPPCREEMPAMERLWRRHQSDGLVIVAISLDADAKVVPPFVKQHGFTFPIALDPKMEVAGAYGVRALPASFIVGRDGYLVALALGPRVWDNDFAHSLIEGLK
jgi:peroxiredoxin